MNLLLCSKNIFKYKILENVAKGIKRGEGFWASGPFVERPHRGQQVTVSSAKIFLGLRAVRTQLGPPDEEKRRTDWLIHWITRANTRYIQCFWCAHMHTCQAVGVLRALTILTGCWFAQVRRTTPKQVAGKWCRF